MRSRILLAVIYICKNRIEYPFLPVSLAQGYKLCTVKNEYSIIGGSQHLYCQAQNKFARGGLLYKDTQLTLIVCGVAKDTFIALKTCGEN